MGNKKKKVGPLSSKLFILHGWAYSIEKWSPFLNLLEQSGIEYEMLKIPGLTAPLKRVWAINDYVGWLYRTTQKYKPITILGHSNGGRIAAAFAAKYPSKVSKLILIDSAGIYHQDILIQIKRFTFRNLALLKKLVNTSLLQNLFYKIVREYDYHKASPIMKGVLQNLLDSDRNNPFGEIRATTILIWGEHDNITPLSDGKTMNEKIKNSKLFVVKDAGHSPQFTNTKEVFDIVKENL